METYTITVSNIFDADSPEDAVLQMVEWLIDSASTAGYRVARGTEPDAPTEFFDAEKISRNSLDID